MAVLTGARNYWDSEESVEPSHKYAMAKADELKQDLSDLGVPVDNVSVLDLGCGTGRIALMYTPSKYIGVDQSELMLNKATELLVGRPEVTLVNSTIYSFKADEHFDTVLLIDVLPHQDEKGCVSEFRRVLRNFNADVCVMRLFVSLTGENIHFKSDTRGYFSISYTPDYIEQELLPLAKSYGKEAFLMLSGNISPSIANGYIVAYPDDSV